MTLFIRVLCLQNKLYVFGGEIGFSSNGETPLWILDLSTTTWRKLTVNPSPSTSLGMAPTGRRGHSSVLYDDAMHVYGGYQDLRGSSSELWTFDFSESFGYRSPVSYCEHSPQRQPVFASLCLYDSPR